MFYKEANGLDILREGGLRTPNVIDHFEHMEDQFLILEYIAEEKVENKFWSHFEIEKRTCCLINMYIMNDYLKLFK